TFVLHDADDQASSPRMGLASSFRSGCFGFSSDPGIEGVSALNVMLHDGRTVTATATISQKASPGMLAAIRKLTVPPDDRPFTQEVLGYGVFAAALIVISEAVESLAFGHVRHVETLPYLPVRFGIVFLAVVFAIAPSIMAMFRVGAATRQDKVPAAKLV